jgi:hypothetical protein
MTMALIWTRRRITMRGGPNRRSSGCVTIILYSSTIKLIGEATGDARAFYPVRINDQGRVVFR